MYFGFLVDVDWSDEAATAFAAAAAATTTLWPCYHNGYEQDCQDYLYMEDARITCCCRIVFSHVYLQYRNSCLALAGVDRSTDAVLVFRKVFYTSVTYVKGDTFRPINARI